MITRIVNTPTKISQFHHPSRSNEHVFRLQIPMNNTVTVQVSNSLAQLPNKVGSLFQRYPIIPTLDPRIKTFPSSILLNNIDIILIMKGSVRSNNIRMTAKQLNLQLRTNSIHLLHIPHLLFSHHLHSK